MTKIMRGFCVVLISFIAVLSGYKIYKISPREFLSDNLRVAYVNENIKGMDIEDFLKFVENEGYNFDKEKIKEIQKKIYGLYLIDTTSLFNTDKNPVLVLDVGVNFPLYYFKLNKYFNFTGENYILKSEYMKSLGLEKFGIDELYMRPHRGNYIFSGKSEKIEELISQRTTMSDEGEKFLWDMEYGNLGILFFSFKKEDVYGLDTLSVVMDYKQNKMNIFSFLSFKELKLKISKDGYKNNLQKYIGEETLYIRNEDYVKGYDIARRYLKRDEKIEFLFNFWQNILGVDVVRMLEDIDQEAIYNFQKESGIVKFKEKERIKKIVGWISQKKNIGLEIEAELEGDYLYFGEERLIFKEKNPVKLKNNQILYYDRKIDGKEMKLEAFNLEQRIKIVGKVNDRVLSEAIDKIENLGRRDEK
ncbi:MAG: hypothetical protein ACRCTS_07800 [Fusobacteriaceae bacterium]